MGIWTGPVDALRAAFRRSVDLVHTIDTTDRVLDAGRGRPASQRTRPHPGSVTLAREQDTQALTPLRGSPTRPRSNTTVTEILSAEQPCILCGMALEIVVIHRDPLTGEERIERTRLEHNEGDCLRMLALYSETWPVRP